MGLSELDTIPETGAIFTIGRSRFADNVASHFFIRKDPVVSITCGDEHSAVICQTGRLFVFGSNDWGQLGLGHKNHISKPSCVKILKPERVTHVACGRAHTLICTGAQKIFACGSDQEGQLGRGTSAIGDSASTPVLVYDSGLAGSKIVQIAAGSHHSLALTNDGGVFAWGSNLEGQLGLPDVSGLVNKPTKVHIPEPVKQIDAGYYHSTFLTESGSVYVCGESEGGKLGIDVNFSTQIAPKQMQLPSPAVHVACGGHHTIILAENGNLYCTGSNASGQLGLGTKVSSLQTPKLLSRSVLQNETITRIACGESHTAIVTETGRLFTCGDGRHAKLGLEENENNVHELTFTSRYKDLFVTNVACGGCHTILVAHRRETNNRESESMQAEHIQKRNSLPPLKLPVNRLQNETHEEKINEEDKNQSNEGNNNLEAANTTVPPSSKDTASESIHDSAKHIENNITNNGIDSTNDTDKPNSPEEPTEMTSTKVSSDVPSNEASSQQTVEESQKSNVQNGNVESENNNNKTGAGVDAEYNVQEEKKSETMNGEENNDATESETNEQDMRNHMENDEEKDKESNTANVEHNNNNDGDQTETMGLNKEMKSDDSTNGKTSPEKRMSPLSSTPPPKPPRLKPGSGSNSSTERTSSMDKEDEAVDADNNETKEESIVRKAETTEGDESAKRRESSSTKSSRKNGSSRSSSAKVDTEETIEIEKQNDKVDGKEKIIEQQHTNDNAQDDADVVQSPVLKAGKISKIFKTKKQQGMENGTKAAGTIHNKSKSKTCTIL